MKKTTFKAAKIVRDNIITTCAQAGVIANVHEISKEEFVHYAKQKLVEEAHEVVQAESREHLIDEIGDVRELLETIQRELAISDDEVRAAQDKKRAVRGGYTKRLWSTSVVMGPEAPWYDEFMGQPDKYPVIKEEEGQ